MKESIGSTQLFIIVITLVLLFAGIMTMTIKRSNAFAIKDSIITIIEKNGGFKMGSEASVSGSDAIDDIVAVLADQAYRQSGTCSAGGDVIGYARNGKVVYGMNKPAFCIHKHRSLGTDGAVQKYYYTVELFYSLDLPIIKDTFNFKVTGETKALFE